MPTGVEGVACPILPVSLIPPHGASTVGLASANGRRPHPSQTCLTLHVVLGPASWRTGRATLEGPSEAGRASRAVMGHSPRLSRPGWREPEMLGPLVAAASAGRYENPEEINSF